MQRRNPSPEKSRKTEINTCIYDQKIAFRFTRLSARHYGTHLKAILYLIKSIQDIKTEKATISKKLFVFLQF